MKILIEVIFALLLVTPTAVLAAAQTNEKLQTDVVETREKVDDLSHDIEIIRRDQTNYRIEKDLLKEAYSSNLASVNLVITLAFGIFGILGYLGVRSIKEIKTDYSKELETLRELKTEFEAELQTLVAKQEIVENQVTNLTKTNEEQDHRLKILELIEKVSGLVQRKQWRWAQEYITVGLGMDSANVQLLQLKVTCHGKLGELNSQIETYRKLLEIDPNRIPLVCNLLEAYALGKDIRFSKLYDTYKAEIEVEQEGALAPYLIGISKLMTGQLKEAAEQLRLFADTCHQRAKPYLGTWSFDELAMEVSNLPDGNQKKLLLKTRDFFSGALTPEEFKAALAAQ